MPTSAPVSPAVWENTTTISETDSPFTPYARKRAVRALVGALGAHHVEHVLLPVAHRALGLAPQPARGAAEVLADVGEQLLAGRQALPRRLGALGGGLGVLEDQRLEARLDRDGDALGLLAACP